MKKYVYEYLRNIGNYNGWSIEKIIEGEINTMVVLSKEDKPMQKEKYLSEATNEELRKTPFADSVFQIDMLRQSFITTIQSFLELLLEDLGENNER